MQKSIPLLCPDNESRVSRLPETAVQFFLGLFTNPSQDTKFRRVAQTGELAQSLLRALLQAMEFARHKIAQIICVLLAPKTAHLPAPGGIHRVEPEQSFFGEGGEKL